MSSVDSAVNSEVFVSNSKTGVLLAIYLLEETFYRELARTPETRLYTIQRIVEGYEEEGIVRTTLLGSERRVALNPSYFAAKELRSLLSKLASANLVLASKVAASHRRPRKRGKAFIH